MNTKIKKWMRAALIRAAKTFAQTVASLITVGGIIQETDWLLALSAGAVAFVYSVLTSVAGIPEAKE